MSETKSGDGGTVTIYFCGVCRGTYWDAVSKECVACRIRREERREIAKKIMDACMYLGIDKEFVYADRIHSLASELEATP